jgi:2-phospho-L-lactate/phosphoenolpyruvate guanylyltransferase
MSTLAVLPVKSFTHAKQRLAEELSEGRRKALAEAMFADVLTALRRTRELEGVVVVTGDLTAQQLAAADRVEVLDDRDERGQSWAAERGARRAADLGADRVLLVPGDCPALVPAELSTLLRRPEAPRPSAVVVPDRHGTGTNGLLLGPPGALVPAFGPDSRSRHEERARSAGVHHETVDVPSLGLDVDTPEDFAALREHLERVRGGAAHTRGLLSRLARAAAA